ncbi:hypothetical protein L1987_71900 [Smallanthus sonchifolius]|uniref:Uncharacterized protein n=1 Tax=Smallanthus sonchifolius TaxID=185202 RepID=A0ACB9AUK9_9ASTR|nr:hypothetical protein L1987_71900 [Smallanthus sonchifolius]
MDLNLTLPTKSTLITTTLPPPCTTVPPSPPCHEHAFPCDVPVNPHWILVVKFKIKADGVVLDCGFVEGRNVKLFDGDCGDFAV